MAGSSEGQIKSAEPHGWEFAVRALRSRNYRLFAGGQLISLTGSWLTMVATNWLVYELTGSVVLLGVAGFAGQIPAFFIAPFSGVLVDRWPLRRVLVITQFLAMLESTALAVLTLTGLITIEWLIILFIIQGMINAFDIPARQAFVVQMIDRREDLPNAIALNSSMFNVARFLGPAVAGVLIAAVGTGWCFAIDAVSYLFVIAAFFMMHVTWTPRSGPPKKMLHELSEGWNYVRRFAPMRSLLTLLALVSLVGMPYFVLLPAFAKSTLAGGATAYGFLMAGAGAGAFIGAIHLALQRSVLGLGKLMGLAAVSFGCMLIVFGFTTWLPISILLIALAGFCQITLMASGNTLLQTIVDDDKRGRVMSFYMMSFMGMMPLGKLLYGYAADHVGTPTTIQLGGVLVLLAGAIFLLRLPKLRVQMHPIYVSKGLVPPVPAGVSTAPAISQVAEE